MNKKYIENYRQIKIFKIKYGFTKHETEIPVIPVTRYFLAFDITGAMKECEYQYSQGDKKYVIIYDIETCGYPVGIHHFT